MQLSLYFPVSFFGTDTMKTFGTADVVNICYFRVMYLVTPAVK